MSSLPTHFHPHLPVSHSDALSHPHSLHPTPPPPPTTCMCAHTHTLHARMHEHRHPHSTQIPPTQSLLSLIMNTEADRIACKCTHVCTHTYTDLSAAPALCNTTSTRHGLEYPPIVSCQKQVVHLTLLEQQSMGGLFSLKSISLITSKFSE